MRKELSKILVTGGAGFMGSAFVRLLLNRGSLPRRGQSLIVIDKLTYAGDLKRLKEVRGRYKFYKANICNKRQIDSIFKREKPEIVVNFAAETHVDKSIVDATPFIETNIRGTQILLDIALGHKINKFIHISTDECYGDTKKRQFTEESPLRPSSPYAASKVAADLLIKSYIRTYNFPAIIIRACNTYGPWQYPEKLIPLAILKILRGEKIPVYGDGKNVREWLYVDDCVEAIQQILKKGKIGEIYNLGSTEEKQNIKVAKIILSLFKKKQNMVEFVQDRPGHDIRYKLNSQKIFNEIGWKPKIKFEKGIKLTLCWCVMHKDWLFSKWSSIARLYK